MKNAASLPEKILSVTVIVTGLGYFTDMFDMFLFNMLRVKSLTDLGFTGDALTQNGFFIIDCQWAGFILGAFGSGWLGDRIGRKASLFIAILLYSLGSIGCSFVTDVHAYALARFVTGLGLAGELGTGITLIAEKLGPARRGVGIMIFITCGYIEVLAAGLVSEYVPWRTAYLAGGGCGLAILLTRTLLSESGLFEGMTAHRVARGGLGPLWRDKSLLKKYLGAIFLIAPGAFMPQIVWTLSPEIGKAMGLADVKANVTVAVGFTGIIIADLLACFLSERLGSRKKATLVFLSLGALLFLKYVLFPVHGLTAFYLWNGALGMTGGAWVVGCVWAAENFGTNIRATTSTTIPNLARAMTVVMNLAYAQMKGLGALGTIGIIGAVVFLLAFTGWRALSETYGRDLDFVTA